MVREKHDKLLDIESSTGGTCDVTVSENNVELLKEVVRKSYFIWPSALRDISGTSSEIGPCVARADNDKGRK